MHTPRNTFSGRAAAVLAVVIGLGCHLSTGRAQPPNADVPGAEVLTRGPVHEAFAGIVTFNPAPGIVVSKGPPGVIEELPPDERPAGDNVAWIPGYWAWDDERRDFLWISGTWRALPPGRAWMAGYWTQTNQGSQWISGYWTDATAQVTTYLPPPPATVEAGPNLAAPSPDYAWTPGCWIWFQGRYAWRPGYWVQVQAEWDWIPAHYIWTPRGYIFVEGFWDYPVERRGILFAPIYFEGRAYSRRGYTYSPRIVINLSVFSDHLFLRPSYQHYYFGDYYAPSYERGGFFASFSFSTSRSGYDPFYSRQRWDHRQDRDWEHRTQISYQNRRDHESARPPRTWTAQRSYQPGPAATERVAVAISIDQLAGRRDGPMRFQSVAQDERQQLAQRGQDVQRSRDQRRTVEATAGRTADRSPERGVEPSTAQLPRSPIVARPGNRPGREQTPPTAPQAPRPDPKVEPRPDAPQWLNRGQPNLAPEPRRAEPERRPAPDRTEPATRERPSQPEADQRARNAAEESQRNARENQKTQRQRDAEQRARETTAPAQAEPPRNERGPERTVSPEAEQRAREIVARANEEAQRKAKESEQGAPKESTAPAKPDPVPDDKDPAKPGKKNSDNENRGKRKPSPPDGPPGS